MPTRGPEYFTAEEEIIVHGFSGPAEDCDLVYLCIKTGDRVHMRITNKGVYIGIGLCEIFGHLPEAVVETFGKESPTPRQVLIAEGQIDLIKEFHPRLNEQLTRMLESRSLGYNTPNEGRERKD